MGTKIFKTYSDFLDRENKEINGVNPEFADEYPDFEKQNESNKGCWNCRDCSYCRGCRDCSGLKGNKEKIEVPVIENIHQKVLEAVSNPGALEMDTWHTCETTHCRAGWVEVLAGDAGRELAKKTSTAFAAMQIYKKSSPIRVSPVRFYEDNKTAMADIKRCAELEKK